MRQILVHFGRKPIYMDNHVSQSSGHLFQCFNQYKKFLLGTNEMHGYTTKKDSATPYTMVILTYELKYEWILHLKETGFIVSKDANDQKLRILKIYKTFLHAMKNLCNEVVDYHVHTGMFYHIMSPTIEKPQTFVDKFITEK
ncbi:hypothetical protein RF11_01018 [Thelohanellus kitauei]|uniref:Uncharacterized protein n=1 Tax=Thelohanellus kitauei TaxID=669202 RepID=A0A0C2NCL7_THEKT|nr:hypothetical protein RF11_01018 [Thelohanellus kitauei]